jgi:ABC-type transporter Mla subunit MlaD
MRESASELKSAAESMSVFSSHIRDAGNKLSGAVTEAVETTKDLALQNQASAHSMESLRAEILNETAKFSEIADQIDGMIVNAGSTFTELKSSQSDYLRELKGNVSDLTKQMTHLLSEYAEQANAQTTNHLNIWAQSSSHYAESMNNAARALSGVVDEIQDKVGA